MVTLASGTRVTAAYIEEVTRGTTPATGPFQYLRRTSTNVNLQKTILESAEIDTTRQTSDVRHGFNSVEGTHGFELSRAAFDDFLRFATGGTWADHTAVLSESSVDIASGVFSKAGATFVTDGVQVGDIIRAASFVGNTDADHQVTAVTETTIAVTTTLVDDASSAGTLAGLGNRVEMGTNLYSFSYERGFEDIHQYQLFRGCVVNGMTLSVEPESIVGGEFQILGMSSPALQANSYSTAVSDQQTTSDYDITGPDTIDRATGSFITDGVVVGQKIVTSGFTNAANNGTFTVDTVTALQVTTIEQTLVTESSAASATQFVSPQIGVKLGAPSNTPLAAFDGTLFEGASSAACITAFSMDLQNNRTLQACVGSKFSADVFDGTAQLTGEITVLFEDAVQFNKFVDETESSIWIKMEEPGSPGNFISLVLNRVKYTGNTIDPPQEGPVPLTMPFRALPDLVTGSYITIQRSN